MAKKEKVQVKLQIPAGSATPSPPVGPALGQHGVNIMEFCKQFNAKTGSSGQDGMIVPVIVTIYTDRSFSFELKTPPASVLIKKAAGIAKGAHATKNEIIAEITKQQVLEIAKMKLPDLNTKDLDAAIKSIEGTAKSMGVKIVN
jgi:large subunit ribosomal protein L11